MLSILEGTNILKERRWAQRIAGGDEKACEDFIDTFGSRIRNLARQHAKNDADIDDLTQEIIIDIFRCIGTYQGKSRLYTWVYRVALNHCLRHCERKSIDMLPLDDALVSARGGSINKSTSIHINSRYGNPEAVAVQIELSEKIHTELENLTNDHRNVIILHELHGLTYNECAEVLGIPIGTVKSRLSNAFHHLRLRLNEYILGDETTLQKVSEILQ